MISDGDGGSGNLKITINVPSLVAGILIGVLGMWLYAKLIWGM